jgi:thermolysin
MIRGAENRGSSLLQKKTAGAKSIALVSPSYIAREVIKGNLKLKRTETDLVAGMQHRRYAQFYGGLEVLGAQVIQHVRSGRLISTTGEYYEGINIDITPFLDASTATQLYRIHACKPELPASNHGPDLSLIPKPASVQTAQNSALIIYPIADRDYRLAYRITLSDGLSYSMTGIVDAKTGDVIKEYSNVNTQDLTIGVGVGVHGQQFKLPTTFEDNSYWLADLAKVRPYNQLTYDFHTFDGSSYYVATDADNDWIADGSLVNAHAYLGFVYDYYYSVFGRNGIDNANMNTLSVVHYTDGSTYDNAAWVGGGINQMLFYEPGPQNYQTAAALDVIAHEYSHGITDFTSDLIYSNQSGALSESFSDIMGTAVEQYWQDPGQGFDRSDWVIGEDIFSSYSVNYYLRNLTDPNASMFRPGWPYPCHLSEMLGLANTEADDWGGVHFHSTIYSHAYYLLSEGGTNRRSGLSVSGIGIDKATKIFFRAWTYYMTPSSDFLYAANALLQSAYDLYGGSSNEYAQTIRSMEAIGWVVN